MRWIVFVWTVGLLHGCARDVGEAGGPGALGEGSAALEGAGLRIDVSQTSASGLSSGGFMAVQFHVAHSSIMRGVGVFAGGPYACAESSLATALTTCMAASPAPDAARYVSITRERARRGLIDDVRHLRDQRVFLFGGADDRTVRPAVMDVLRDYYAALVDDPSTIGFERRRPGTGHTFPTRSFGTACGRSEAPYLGNCGYDGAARALAQIYGPLEPRASALSGEIVTLHQGDFIDDPGRHSLAEEGYAYVPAHCSSRSATHACRVHVAFHGCKQSVSEVGDAFYRHAGYNEWADTNRIVVLYPQTVATPGRNPNGCWDWWGYDSPDHATRRGPQIEMVNAMVEWLARQAAPVPDGGGGDANPTDRPDEMADGGVGDPRDAAMDVGGAHDASAGDPRDAAPDAGDAHDPGDPHVADAGVGDSRDAGSDDHDVANPDAGKDPPPRECVVASNVEHVFGLRAYVWLGFVYARGSGQPLGPYSSFTETALLRATDTSWTPVERCSVP